MEDFRKYATKHLRMNGSALDSYMNISSSYISSLILKTHPSGLRLADVPQ
jgi:ATP-dependent Clp protease protease subunit